jgi:hypothetical protein
VICFWPGYEQETRRGIEYTDSNLADILESLKVNGLVEIFVIEVPCFIHESEEGERLSMREEARRRILNHR